MALGRGTNLLRGSLGAQNLAPFLLCVSGLLGSQTWGLTPMDSPQSTMDSTLPQCPHSWIYGPGYSVNVKLHILVTLNYALSMVHGIY